MKILDWSPQEDLYLKQGEVHIHNLYHDKIAESVNKGTILGASKRQERIGYLVKALELANSQIHGTVLEVGAGDGWCSAYMLQNYTLDEIYIMEVDRPALEKLIPNTLSELGVSDEKVKYVLGSFNKIHIKCKFDFVVAMGALHHSSNLFQTFRSIYQSLKPGGWLIAQEPYMIDSTKNQYYFNRESQTINFKGLVEVRNNERTDLFYRSCEYQTAALHAGFDYHYHKLILDVPEHEGVLEKISRLAKIRNLGKSKHQTHKSKIVERPENFVIYAQKPYDNNDELPPTAWEY